MAFFFFPFRGFGLGFALYTATHPIPSPPLLRTETTEPAGINRGSCLLMCICACVCVRAYSYRLWRWRDGLVGEGMDVGLFRSGFFVLSIHTYQVRNGER
ncbi:hypothetical protein F5Y00DRAFT_51816 [Daldinia vernicosa]|uniref:uncharacterized protein n=1 Tax=Daldinia vernicosa TaxID=114800 RepID=UPI002008873E|nr:uncharacterized protein F5Y00DRAFT_51816 [Daldinia vernicosa]KAI0849817.1 hypothetical protein F5Y00DRAFT_51816 [Daldinia vernicosa]